MQKLRRQGKAAVNEELEVQKKKSKFFLPKRSKVKVKVAKLNLARKLQKNNLKNKERINVMDSRGKR